MTDREFAVCLTHDVDRPYKTFQAPYDALRERDPLQLRSLVTDDQPYWQFDELLSLEAELGVRSSFYFLNEKQLFRDKHPREWLRPRNWMLFTGRYELTDPAIVDLIADLEAGGWEVGLHGSYESADDRERLREEKETLEAMLRKPVVGGRQHYLNLDGARTWEHHREIGLQYDASFGSSTEYGFNGRYEPIRPFDDEFVVFPLTIMDNALMHGTPSVDAAWDECKRILAEARDNGAVMTILWHPRYMNENEFPGYQRIYRKLIEEALAMNAWVGPCVECYERLEQPKVRS